MTGSPIIAKAYAAGRSPVRVMIVEDSVVVRGLLTRWLESDGEIHVVQSVSDGAQAIERLPHCKAEVVILDIDMPIMDGLKALPKLLELDPLVKVVMSSALTRHNAQISLQALSLGASDYIAKPDTTRGVTTSESFRYDLVEKVKALGAAARGYSMPNTEAGLAAQMRTARPQLHAVSSAAPKIIAIGASTGGPQALMRVLAEVAPATTVPILITQHMPPMFTTILAEHLSKITQRPAREARVGEIPESGTIYVAPGGHHLLARRLSANVVLDLDDGPAENFCKPAVDPMFRSLAAAFGPNVLGVVLTGMGHDGREGARAIVEAGGTVIVQDEASSVVWGMPGSVAAAGLASAILPLDEIASRLITLMKAKRS